MPTYRKKRYVRKRAKKRTTAAVQASSRVLAGRVPMQRYRSLRTEFKFCVNSVQEMLGTNNAFNAVSFPFNQPGNWTNNAGTFGNTAITSNNLPNLLNVFDLYRVDMLEVTWKPYVSMLLTSDQSVAAAAGYGYPKPQIYVCKDVDDSVRLTSVLDAISSNNTKAYQSIKPFTVRAKPNCGFINSGNIDLQPGTAPISQGTVMQINPIGSIKYLFDFPVGQTTNMSNTKLGCFHISWYVTFQGIQTR